jgi:hypothetical protein
VLTDAEFSHKKIILLLQFSIKGYTTQLAWQEIFSETKDAFMKNAS